MLEKINFILHNKRHLSKFENTADLRMSKVCIEFMDQDRYILEGGCIGSFFWNSQITT